jgi:hypothetical protein
MTMHEILAIATKAIETARIDYPNYSAAPGTSWPLDSVSKDEAQLFAYATLQALVTAGVITLKDARPNAPRS